MQIPSRPRQNAHLHLKTTVLKLRIQSWKNRGSVIQAGLKLWRMKSFIQDLSFVSGKQGVCERLWDSEPASGGPRSPHCGKCMSSSALWHGPGVTRTPLSPDNLQGNLFLFQAAAWEKGDVTGRILVLNRGSHTTCLNGHKGNKDVNNEEEAWECIQSPRGTGGRHAGSLPLRFVFLPSGVLFGVTKPAIRLIWCISCHHESIGDWLAQQGDLE